mgnify:CR=1 FL=1
MKLDKLTKAEITLTLTVEEMRILNNAMNETLEELGGDENEFETRMGNSKQKVQELLSAINTLIHQMAKNQD